MFTRAQRGNQKLSRAPESLVGPESWARETPERVPKVIGHAQRRRDVRPSLVGS